ncbi:hypothetical protein PISMIDRAFT_572521 [Pisolithus microcarpus 441]|uniref:G domain-containing protein n=1 Tax=Pisolithus microcarpus 441 TaxID=765257 RepID=A0A0C9ZLL6_9AGAM|nr:P-loop containing nucleoside triphosphate hydrolase protein [Pisolithus microcarpus]KIK20758.1 hypothetical protein PISMIDRAFT_572521 [Pisolithus microcarpus 441]
MSSASRLREREALPISKITRDDIIFLLLGRTGSGKSNFINTLTQMRPEAEVDSLSSCTKEVCTYVCYRDGQRYIFVDTPGLNNGRLQQSEVFKAIARWLEDTYWDSIELTGVIYTQNITDGGRSSTDMQGFQLCRRLCGDQAAKQVRLVTTMWDEVNEAEGDAAEGRLKRAQGLPREELVTKRNFLQWTVKSCNKFPSQVLRAGRAWAREIVAD